MVVGVRVLSTCRAMLGHLVHPTRTRWGMLVLWLGIECSMPNRHSLDCLNSPRTVAWASVLTHDYRRSLVELMPARLLVVPRLRGAHTHY